LAAKTSFAAMALGQQFEKRQVEKTYFAVNIGTMPKYGTIDLAIDGKEALTKFQVIQSLSSDRFNQLNLVQLKPSTGRRHQLRKHLASIGNPILGDKEYGKEGLIHYGKGLYLHAFELCFQHPASQLLTSVRAPLPNKFIRLFPDAIVK